MVTVRFAFRNDRPDTVNVFVEPWPELFRLKPGELLEFQYDAPPEGEAIEVVAHDEGLTLWTGVDHESKFLIDGKPADDRSWKP